MSVIRNGGAAAKTLSFAAVHFTVAFTIAYLLTEVSNAKVPVPEAAVRV